VTRRSHPARNITGQKQLEIITLTKQAAKSREAQTGQQITPAMIEAGLEWLYTYNPDSSHARKIVEEIIRAALANQSQCDQRA
jgi:hypothetical protein